MYSILQKTKKPHMNICWTGFFLFEYADGILFSGNELGKGELNNYSIGCFIHTVFLNLKLKKTVWIKQPIEQLYNSTFHTIYGPLQVAVTSHLAVHP